MQNSSWKFIMGKYIVQQRAKTVELYSRNNFSVVLTQITYGRHLNMRTAPTDPFIRRLVAQFRDEGTIADAAEIK
jgi:hypothetical protein